MRSSGVSYMAIVVKRIYVASTSIHYVTFSTILTYQCANVELFCNCFSSRRHRLIIHHIWSKYLLNQVFKYDAQIKMEQYQLTVPFLFLNFSVCIMYFIGLNLHPSMELQKQRLFNNNDITLLWLILRKTYPNFSTGIEMHVIFAEFACTSSSTQNKGIWMQAGW